MDGFSKASCETNRVLQEAQNIKINNSRETSFFSCVYKISGVYYLIMVIVFEKVVFMTFSFFVTLADIKTGSVPRISFLAAFPVFLILALLQADRYLLLVRLLGALLGLFVFLIVFFISAKRLGLADVWYSALGGLVLGLWGWYIAITIACILGVIFILVSKQRRIPFIPFMAFGSVAVSIVQWCRQ